MANKFDSYFAFDAKISLGIYIVENEIWKYYNKSFLRNCADKQPDERTSGWTNTAQ